MTAAYGGSADAALAEVRPVVTRIDASQSAEDLAADLIEIWTGLETSLRSMLGGSSLSGQALVREVRQREMITLNQAHSLLQFLAARERCDNVSYQPTRADVAAAKEAFAQLDTAAGAPGRDAATAGAASAMAGAPAAGTGYSSAQRAAAEPPAQATVTPAPLIRERAAGLPTWGWIAIAAVALVFAGIAAYNAMQNRGSDMDRAIRTLAEGKREAARGEFTRIARENPELAAPHVFLARIAREEGELATARREIETAIRLDPDWSVAQREMGMLLLSQGNYDLARRFFVRAVQLNPADSAAKGFLGCSLIRLGNRDLGMRFITQAGTGAWTPCAR